MYESAMVIFVTSVKFLNLYFKFCLFEWVSVFHFTMDERIKKSSTYTIDLRCDTAKVSFKNSIKTIFLNLSGIVIILPGARRTSNYFCLTTIFSLGSIYPVV